MTDTKRVVFLLSLVLGICLFVSYIYWQPEYYYHLRYHHCIYYVSRHWNDQTVKDPIICVRGFNLEEGF